MTGQLPNLFIDQDGDACFDPPGADRNLVALPARDDDGSLLNPEIWHGMIAAWNHRAALTDAESTIAALTQANAALAADNARMAKRVEDARGAIDAVTRCLMPVDLTLLQEEMCDRSVPDDSVILHFIGSGMSDMVTAKMVRDALTTARAWLAGGDAP